jgi:HSP20 family protein
MMYRTAMTTPVFGLRREIDRLFEDAFGREGGRAGWTPTVDVREDAKSLRFEFELAGLRPEQVEITADNGVLTVRGEKEERRESEEGRHHIAERSYGSFTRSFQLPQGVDDDRIEASFAHGVLTVVVPKAALPQPRKIAIRGGEVEGGANGQAQIQRGNAEQNREGGREKGREKNEAAR